MVLLVGIDEAGKGPVIGPMVVAAVAIDEQNLDSFAALGFKDSKQLSHDARDDLFPQVAKHSHSHSISIISPEEIDSAIKKPGDNILKLEIRKIAELITELKPDKVICDCPSPNRKSFIASLKQMLPETLQHIEIIADFKADINYPVVSAASILAKVTRDREIAKLHKKFRVKFGSGYASDPKTVKFVDKHWNTQKYSAIFRKSWETWKKRHRDAEQQTIPSYS